MYKAHILTDKDIEYLEPLLQWGYPSHEGETLTLDYELLQRLWGGLERAQSMLRSRQYTIEQLEQLAIENGARIRELEEQLRQDSRI